MELSRLSKYPVSDPFVFDNGDVLEVCWDANFFSRARLRQFDEELGRLTDEARAPHAERLNALQAEVGALAEAQGERKPTPEEEQRLNEIVAEVESAAEALEQAVDEAACAHYGRVLAGEILLGWGMTEGGQAVPLSAEVLSAQPLLFLQDLTAHCRRRSLPKSRRQVTASLTPPPVTHNGSLNPTSRPPTPFPTP